MVKYTGEQKLHAVRLYERYGHSTVAVIDELGYPSGQTLAVWHRFMGAGRPGPCPAGHHRKASGTSRRTCAGRGGPCRNRWPACTPSATGWRSSWR